MKPYCSEPISSPFWPVFFSFDRLLCVRIFYGICGGHYYPRDGEMREKEASWSKRRSEGKAAGARCHSLAIPVSSPIGFTGNNKSDAKSFHKETALTRDLPREARGSGTEPSTPEKQRPWEDN
jgi:hypothetical protein